MIRDPRLRNEVRARDKGTCALCHVNVFKLVEKLARKRVKPSWLPAGFEPEKADAEEWRKLAIQYVLELWGMPRNHRSSLWTCDHRIPLAEGGKDDIANAQTLCLRCDHRKTHRYDIPRIAKSRRKRAKFDKHREIMAAKFPFQKES